MSDTTRSQTKKPNLTRLRIKAFIIDHIKEHGYSPSYEEIGAAVGLSSKSSTHAHIKQLLNDGELETDHDGVPRAIRVPGYRFVREADCPFPDPKEELAQLEPTEKPKTPDPKPEIMDMARYIVEKTGKMIVWKLHKLCFYAQAAHIVRTGSPMVDEQFLAWSNGPIAKHLNDALKGVFVIDIEHLPTGTSSKLKAAQKQDIDKILSIYGEASPEDLRLVSRKEQPWLDARKDTPDGAQSDVVISNDSIKAYYREKGFSMT